MERSGERGVKAHVDEAEHSQYAESQPADCSGDASRPRGQQSNEHNRNHRLHRYSDEGCGRELAELVRHHERDKQEQSRQHRDDSREDEAHPLPRAVRRVRFDGRNLRRRSTRTRSPAHLVAQRGEPVLHVAFPKLGSNRAERA